MTRKHRAVESLSFEEALNQLPSKETHAWTVLQRLNRVCPRPEPAVILDVGCAHGCFLIGCAKRGFKAIGVELSETARQVATQLAAHEGVSIEVLPGIAENLPLQPECVDIVHSMSVIEHVRDARAAFREAYRVLKPGGIFWFYTASSMSPRQGEIRGFPCFGGYPDRLKRRIMDWAVRRRPGLVGHTKTPAIHWFTPWKARRMLQQTGFKEIYDRWDLRLFFRRRQGIPAGLALDSPQPSNQTGSRHLGRNLLLRGCQMSHIIIQLPLVPWRGFVMIGPRCDVG